eukprot:scaffold29032_cov60-Phaeocystis_antarctica.AAC.1
MAKAAAAAAWAMAAAAVAAAAVEAQRRLATRPALGVEGGRAQELTNSPARRRDRARLAVAVGGGVVGRANTVVVYSARTNHVEVKSRTCGRVAGAARIANGLPPACARTHAPLVAM